MKDGLKLFGRRLRVARKAAKLTIEGVADRAGLNPKYYGEIERGNKRPSFEAILALADALGVQPRVLFQFERDEVDPVVLRGRIESVLTGCSSEQLQQAYRMLKAFVEP
jgi:transcriptional regulator with XRE-family HTH domain